MLFYDGAGFRDCVMNHELYIFCVMGLGTEQARVWVGTTMRHVGSIFLGPWDFRVRSVAGEAYAFFFWFNCRPSAQSYHPQVRKLCEFNLTDQTYGVQRTGTSFLENSLLHLL